MKKTLAEYVVCMLVSLFWTTATGEVTIVVEMGKYATAEQAANDEANVNWRDADTSDDTVCTECFAATELARYLGKMSGQQIPIVSLQRLPAGDLILVGRKAAQSLGPAGLSVHELTDLGREGFVIKTVKSDGRSIVFIAGAERVGTLYGVYEFLERLGVRWFAPGVTNEYVPQRRLGELPEMNVRERPAFFTRGFWAWENRGNDEFHDWMARNKMNLWTDAQANHPALKKRGLLLTCGGHIHEAKFIGPQLVYPYNHPKFVGDEDKPDDPYPVSPDFLGDVNGDRKLQYCEAHPEWYGLRNGKRSFYIVDDSGDNFCTSNKYACDELMKKLVQDLIDGEWQDADSVNFWTLDGGTWCECQECKALGTPTDRNLLLVHRLRTEIKKAMTAGRLKRNVQVMFLAYADVIAPPTKPLPSDFDYKNCIATFFPIGRCYVHSFADPKCTEINQRYLKQYIGWAIDPNRHYKGQIFIGEYYNVSIFKCLPIVYFHTMSADIPYYYQTGARHMHYMHCTTKNWGTRALTNYQMAKMLWNPNIDTKALLDDYLACRYGPAKETMRKFYKELEQAFSNCRILRGGLVRALELGAKNLFPTKHLHYEEFHPPTDDGPDFEEIMRHIDEARSLIETAMKQELSTDQKARLAEDYQALMYGWNTLHLYDALVKATLAHQAGKTAEAEEQLRNASALVKILQADTESAAYSSSHASARNALDGTRLAGAYWRLQMEIGPIEPEKIKTFDPNKGSLTILGADFIGGGQVLYGPGIRAGGRVLSQHGNYLYAQQMAPYNLMVAMFRLERVLNKGRLILLGMSCPKERGTLVPIRIKLNDVLVFEGEGPFPEGKLSSQEYEIPSGALKAGLNRLSIENLIKQGSTGQRPWFGVDRVTIVAE